MLSGAEARAIVRVANILPIQGMVHVFPLQFTLALGFLVVDQVGPYSKVHGTASVAAGHKNACDGLK